MSTAAAPFTVLIPARLASTRLPNKPLADIAGLPMVVHVARRAAQSQARQVVVAADDGRRIQFPAAWLQRFLTHQGVQGRFEMRFGADRKLIDLRRIGD